MATKFDVDGEGLIRSSNIIQGNSNYTCLITAKVGAAPSTGDYRTIWATRNAGYTAYVGIFSDIDANTFSLQVDNGAGGTDTSIAVTLEEDIRGSFAYVRDGNDHLFYFNGELIDTVTVDVSAVTFADEVVGDDGASVADIEVQYFREWPNTLTLAEIITDWNSPTVVSPFCWTDTPLVSDLLDDAGLSHDWTAVGSVTFVDGPLPISATNTSSGAAYVISSLPAFLYQVAKNSSGTTTDLWYKYTVVDENVLNAFGIGGYSGANKYDPSLQAYDTALNPWLGAVNRPIQFAVVAGDWYFQLDTPIGNHEGAGTFSLIGFTNENIPDNPIFVPSDNEDVGDGTDVPSTFIDPATGEIKAFNTTFPAGEQGDVLPSGPFLLEDENDGDLKLFAADFTLISAVAFAWTGGRVVLRRGGDGLFYAGNPGTVNAVVQTVDTTGALGTSWTLPDNGLTAIAPSNDGTILYYSGSPLDTDSEIKRFDLVGSTPLSDLVAAVANHRVRDILVLEDDTILVGYDAIGPTTGYFARRYDAAGATLNTYSYSGDFSSDINRLAYASDSPDSFWIWLHETIADPIGDQVIGRFINVDTATGATIIEHQIAEYHHGIGLDGQTANPEGARPGLASSCPFMQLTSGGPEPPTQITVTKVTSDPDDETVFTFTTDGLNPVTFTLSNGESRVFSGLIAGTYSVVEETQAGYTTTYLVSNGDPNTAIVIAEGESVVVTVTNTSVPEGLGGIYKIQPLKRNDTLYTSLSPIATQDVKIPNPRIRTALIGE